MAEITKLSVGKALDKLRGADVPASKIARLDEDIQTLSRETQRLRAMRVSIEHGQRIGSGHEAQASDKGRVAKLKTGMMIGAVAVITILSATSWLFWRW